MNNFKNSKVFIITRGNIFLIIYGIRKSLMCDLFITWERKLKEKKQSLSILIRQKTTVSVTIIRRACPPDFIQVSFTNDISDFQY